MTIAPLLNVENLHVAYGIVPVLRNIQLHVNQGEVVTLIGANGAGKTTLMRTLSGLLTPKSGTISFDGKDISRVPAHRRVAMGLAQSPEGRRIFTRMTVRENLHLGAFTQSNTVQTNEDLERILERFPRLRERINQRAGTLSGGEQQMLAIGRALMSRPRLLLLDEPSMGLAPILVQQIFDIIREIHAAGTTVLLVEQNAVAALSICTRAYVLELGELVREGTGQELLADKTLSHAYLGGAA
jgi:branched-chain amino acid transport system ATP-binding protein